MIYLAKNRAAISLGIPKTTLDRYVNLQNHSVYSSVLDMNVFLIDPSVVIKREQYYMDFSPKIFVFYIPISSLIWVRPSLLFLPNSCIRCYKKPDFF